MDTVALTVSGEIFKASRTVLKKYSKYFDEKLTDGRLAEDLTGIPADAFTVLLNYMTKSELNLTDMSCQLLSSVQDTACFLGLTTFPQDCERVLKATWCNMKDLNAVLGAAARLGVHREVVRSVIEDVLKVLLHDKERGVLRETDLTYEILLFVFRLGTFWDCLMEKCKYFYAYEAFFESVVGWIVKTSALEANVDALVYALRIHTVPWKFLTDCVSNASGLPEMKELLKFGFQKRHDKIRIALNEHLSKFRIVLYDGKQSSIVVQEYSGEKFVWDEKIKFSRLPLMTERCITTKDYAYALGDQTLTSVRLLGSTPLNLKFPERLEMTHCFPHGNNLFCFGWNRRDHVVYEYIPERREFAYRGTSPVDSNIASVCVSEKFYIVGEMLQTSELSHRMTVWMFDRAKTSFVWIADLRKSWCIQDNMDDQETGSNPKAHLLPSGDSMFALVQEKQSNPQMDLYSFCFDLTSPCESEVNPRKLNVPAALDRHSSLVSARESEGGALLLFRTATRGEYSLATLKNNRIELLGFMPTLPSGQCVSLEQVYFRSSAELSEESEQCQSSQNSINTSSKGNSRGTPSKGNSGHMSQALAGSEITLVDEADMPVMRNQDGKNKTQKMEGYKSPRIEDLRDSKESFQSYGGLSRASSRRSSLASAFSRKSSKKEGKRKSFGSKALSVMAGIVS